MKILKVQTATTLRERLFETLKDVSEGDPQLVTHRSGDEVVMISREKLNRILEENEALKAISKGRHEIQAGLGVSQADVKSRMQKKIKAWRKRK